MALCGSFGSSSPKARPAMTSYWPALPKLTPLNAGDCLLSMTILVTRACASPTQASGMAAASAHIGPAKSPGNLLAEPAMSTSRACSLLLLPKWPQAYPNRTCLAPPSGHAEPLRSSWRKWGSGLRKMRLFEGSWVPAFATLSRGRPVFATRACAAMLLLHLINTDAAIGAGRVRCRQRHEDRIVAGIGRNRMGILPGRDASNERIRVRVDDAQDRAGRQVARCGVVLVKCRIVPDLVLTAELVDHLDDLLGRDVDDDRCGVGHLGRARLRAGAAPQDHLGAGALCQAERTAIVDRNELHHLESLRIDDGEPAVRLLLLPDRHRSVEHAGLTHIKRLVDAVARVRHLELAEDRMIALSRDESHVGRFVGVVADQHHPVDRIDTKFVGALLPSGVDGGDDLGWVGFDVDDLDGAVAVRGPELMLDGIESEPIGPAQHDRRPLVGVVFEPDETGHTAHIGHLTSVENVDRCVRSVRHVIPPVFGIDIADVELLELVARYVDDGDELKAGRQRAGADHHDEAGGKNRDFRRMLSENVGQNHAFPPWRSRVLAAALLAVAPCRALTAI